MQRSKREISKYWSPLRSAAQVFGVSVAGTLSASVIVIVPLLVQVPVQELSLHSASVADTTAFLMNRC